MMVDLRAHELTHKRTNFKAHTRTRPHPTQIAPAILPGGWVDALRYEDEIIDDLKKRTGGKEDEVAKVCGGGAQCVCHRVCRLAQRSACDPQRWDPNARAG